MRSNTHPASLPKRERVRKRAEFVLIQDRGRRWNGEHLMVLVGPSLAAEPDRPTRIGITVSKRVGCAVERNRVKRLVREAYRRNKRWFPERLDLVVVARRSAATADYQALAADLERLGARMPRDPGPKDARR